VLIANEYEAPCLLGMSPPLLVTLADAHAAAASLQARFHVRTVLVLTTLGVVLHTRPENGDPADVCTVPCVWQRGLRSVAPVPFSRGTAWSHPSVLRT
jgi:hypothetical protein